MGVLKTTIKNEGMTGLFKGVSSPIIGQAPISGSAFMANEYADRYLQKYNMTHNQKNFLSGCFAGAMTTIFTTPVEFMKIQKQLFKGDNLSYYSILKDKGPLGVFKGFSATVIRDVPG
jgi:hypothetical protein